MSKAQEKKAAFKKAEKKKIIYMDNNSTTLCPPIVIETMMKWINRGNPSSEYASARESKKLMDSFREYVANACGFNQKGPRGYTIIFTSGASESNNFMVSSAVRSFAYKTGKLPHVITSAVEHKSLLECCIQLEKEGLTQLTILPVGVGGQALGAVDPADVQRAIRPNTCLVSIMAANNETGIMNDVRAIGAIARAAKVPFHTDAVQVFGKSPLKPNDALVDAFSVSFHKLHAPAGIGLLVLKNNLIEGYELCAHICGAQNGGLRGGTEPIHNIAAAFQAFKWTLDQRSEKNANVKKMREVIKGALAKSIPCFYIDDYLGEKGREAAESADRGGSPVVVWIAPKETAKSASLVLPNTLFLSVHRPRFCNKAARAALEARGIIVSVGSACNSESHGPSGVVEAMGVPRPLQDGVLRVSLSDDVSISDVQQFVKAFLAVVTSGECLRATP